MTNRQIDAHLRIISDSIGKELNALELRRGYDESNHCPYIAICGFVHQDVDDFVDYPVVTIDGPMTIEGLEELVAFLKVVKNQRRENEST